MTPQEKHDKILIENKPFFDKRLIEQGKQEERQRLAREIRMIKVEDGLDSNYLWSEGFDAGQNNMLRRILELLEGK